MSRTRQESAGVVTLTTPLVAPADIAVVISVADTTVNVAAVPLKVTAVAPVRLFPSMATFLPTFPKAGSAVTKRRNPAEKL
jgi:hypothetical protein